MSAHKCRCGAAVQLHEDGDLRCLNGHPQREIMDGLVQAFAGLVAGPLRELRAEGQWAENYGGSVGSHLDPAIPAADFDALTAAAAEVKNWVDRHVAHADASAVPASVTLTLQDIHDPIDVIGELFRRYYTLFTAADMPDLVPLLPPTWKAVFVEPWIRPGSASALPFGERFRPLGPPGQTP